MPTFSANLSFLYPDLPFTERFAAAARDGFKAVEYLGPYDLSAEEMADLLKKNGVEQALFNVPSGNWTGGERGIACLPDRKEEFRDGVETAVRYAEALGCKRLNVIAGIAPKGVPAEALEETLVENLRHAALRVKAAGIKLLIEPINLRDIPSFFLSRTDHAERIPEKVGSDNLFIQYDFYHMQVMQGDLLATFERLKDRVAHVQIADNPGRFEPGTGEINYPFLFEALDRFGYDGWVGCEYKPEAGTGAGLGWADGRI